jgi:hypothetical protein
MPSERTQSPKRDLVRSAGFCTGSGLAGRGQLIEQRCVSHFLNESDKTLLNEVLVQRHRSCCARLDLAC